MRKMALSEGLWMMERVEKVTGISMRIRYKNQELVIFAMKMGMRLIGWSGDFDGLRIFAVSGRDRNDVYEVGWSIRINDNWLKLTDF
jgi:hypothetical protein